MNNVKIPNNLIATIVLIAKWALGLALAVGVVGCTSAPPVINTEETQETTTPTYEPEPYVEPEPVKTDLQLAKDYCNVLYPKGKQYVEVTDNGQTLLVDTESEYGSIENAGCFLAYIDTPRRITSAMSNTTALMGAQTDQANGYTYRWTYHPDNGVNIIVSSLIS